MIARRTFMVAVGAAVGVTALRARSQPAAAMRRIGFLSLGSAADNATRIGGLRAGLRDLGYIEGKNLTIDYRWADGNAARLPELAAELAKQNVEVIVTHGPPGIRAAQQATSSIPIVIAAIGDVVAGGFVPNMARPGGNITGMSFFSPQLSAKRLELVKEVLPRIPGVAVLFNPDNPVNGPAFEAVEAAAKSMKLMVKPFHARARTDFESAFAAMAKAYLNVVALVEDPVLNTNFSPLAQLAAKHRMASFGNPELADAGGFIGYGASITDLFRRSAYFVDRILKGARPADLPIEQPAKFDLTINMKTAKALGVGVPQSLLARADKVIG
jgi:putative ABC transport system substrate-binding protein